MLKRLNTPLAILGVFAAGLLAAPAQALPGWNLVWADEFDHFFPERGGGKAQPQPVQTPRL